MATDPRNPLLFLNSSQTTYWNYYNWCADYPTGPVIWSAISVICFLLGFPASLWVLHELLQRQRQKSTSDVFMLSLAVFDLIFTTQIPFYVCNFMLWHIKVLEVLLDLIYCLSFIGRPLFMACICWDCYVAVVYPILYKTSKKLIVIKKAIMIVICFSVVVVGLFLCTMTWLVATFLMAIPLIVALPVITFCDISILQALRKPDPTGNNTIHPQKKRALHTISNSFIMTFIVYLPTVMIFSCGSFIPLTEIERFCLLDFFGFCLSMAGCVIMPIMYLVTMGKLDIFKNCSLI